MQGFLLIDKPDGMTSHDVVDRVRRITGIRRVGHAGTLDPFATGLLIVGVGRPATREMRKLIGLDKKYEAVFVLGASSTTDDPEGEITEAPLALKPETSILKHILNRFIGEIKQIPPSYSAIKIGGKKMYEAARSGKPIKAEARTVAIHSILPNGNPPLSLMGGCKARLGLSIHCSSGTYIRAIARDLGKVLGGGGYVEKLRRGAIGPFSIKEARELNSLEGRTQDVLIPVESFLARF